MNMGRQPTKQNLQEKTAPNALNQIFGTQNFNKSRLLGPKRPWARGSQRIKT